MDVVLLDIIAKNMGHFGAVLLLQVKVRPNWLEEAERYSEMGLDFKDGNA